MYHIDIIKIKSWERFYRANFINSLTGFKSVSLIGTVNRESKPNLAVFSSIVHLGSDPALVGYINRPIAAAPHTMANIEATGVYSINHIQPSFVDKAHQASAKYDQGISEFDATGLTPVFRENIKAPFVAESNIQYALSLLEIVPISHNNTFLVIGAITDVFLVDKSLVLKDGFIPIEKSGSIMSLGADGYYSAQPIGRFAYAKPGKPTTKIEENY